MPALTNYQDQIRRSFWQGMVKLAILHKASLGPVYGGRLRKYLGDRGHKISPGTLYPLLHSLERESYLQSCVKVYKGRARKYYETTPIGQSCLNELRQQASGIVKEIICQAGPDRLRRR
jgi:DNA-binding PadR family transcriptional regulator